MGSKMRLGRIWLFLIMFLAEVEAFVEGKHSSVALTAENECKASLDSLKWQACRKLKSYDITEQGKVLSQMNGEKEYNKLGFFNSNYTCIPVDVPGTALGALLSNGTFEGIDHENIYYSYNLQKIPDINHTGRDFYTFWYRAEGHIQNSDCFSEKSENFIRLSLRSVNYKLSMFINGKFYPQTNNMGMYRRFNYDVSAKGHSSKFALAALIEPPIYPGNVDEGGQGGDHEIARNAAIMQFTAGWDWIQATPDRNTGPWDEVSLAMNNGVILSDPRVTTLQIQYDNANISAAVFIKNPSTTDLTGQLEFEFSCPKPNSKQFEQNSVRIPEFTLKYGNEEEISTNISMSHVKFWYPHTMGEPSLCNMTVLYKSKDKSVQSTLSFKFGIKYMETYIDQDLEGRVFKINNKKIFLKGGNWIASDQLLRYSSGIKGRARYDAEVRMHRDMGLNIIRVWGGGLAERPEFYDACDKYGVLVMQEFWMTGDNNGRWAGSYNSPENHEVYLLAVRDTIRMLRRHTSLLFWCGGNELYETSVSPPPEILSQMKEYISILDPKRFFIQSSMTDAYKFDATVSLAPRDGPYGYLPQNSWYIPNPGMSPYVKIAFQPEIGSVSTPVFQSLKRFLSSNGLNNFPVDTPPFGEGDAPPEWVYHKFLPYNGAINSYMAPKDIQGYSYRAQLAQYQQYKMLYEGFQERMWTRYSAVIMWKSQSPWPALRGAFYDYYLAATGGFYGARSAGYSAESPYVIQMNPLTRSITLINTDYTELEAVYIKVSAFQIDKDGSPECKQCALYLGPYNVANQSSLTGLGSLQTMSDTVLLWRLALIQNGSVLAENEYHQSDFSKDQNYTSLGVLRKEGNPGGVLIPHILDTSKNNGKDTQLVVRVDNSANFTNKPFFAAFGVRLSVRKQKSLEDKITEEDRILPVYISDGYFTLLPRESKVVNISIPIPLCEDLDEVTVVVEAFNMPSSTKSASLSES